MMNEQKKKRIKIVLVLFVVLVLAIVLILIGSKQVANPITKNANQRTQFFVDLGNLLPKKKDTIKNGTTEDTTNNTNASSTADTIIPTGGSLVPTKDTNKDGVVDNKDAVIDTNKDGVVDNKDTSAELLQEIVNPTPDNGPSAIPANNEEAWKEIIKRDTIATKDLVVTASTDMAKTRDQLTISWSSPTKMEFASCVGSYAGGVYQQKDLKSKGITLTAYVQKALYGWDGKQAVPTKPQTKKTQMPYGDKEIIYVLTCEKKPQTVISSTEKTETTSGGFGTTEGETEKMDTTPPKEYVVAQVALILDDGTFGNGTGGSNTTKDCSAYPANVSALMPECNQNANGDAELSLVASPAVVTPGGNSTLFWFSPAGTAFTSCEGVGAGATVQSGGVDTSAWIGKKPVPDTTTPVQKYDVTPKNKDSRYAISCVTKAGKTLRANANIQIQSVNTGNDLCAGLPLNLQKLYCPDVDKDNFFDTDTYVPDTTGNVCATGTSGQNTPIILTASEQEEYQKLLRQFFRLLPEIRTPESITNIGHDIEEVRNTGNYIDELTQLCWEQTDDTKTDLTLEWSKCGQGQAVPGIVADLCKMPKRRVSPFFVSNDVIFSPDQETASGDKGQFDLSKRKEYQEFIIPWTHVNKSKFSRGGYEFGIAGKSYANPRAKANTDIFYSIGQESNEFSDKDPWDDIQDAVKNAFYYRPYAGYTYSIKGIGFNCNSDIHIQQVYVGYEFAKTYDTGKDWYNPEKKQTEDLFDTVVKCGFSTWFEQIFGIGQ